jgi:hypothetical protein
MLLKCILLRSSHLPSILVPSCFLLFVPFEFFGLMFGGWMGKSPQLRGVPLGKVERIPIFCFVHLAIVESLL